MDNLGHIIADGFRGIAGNVIGVLKESKFYQDGVLTPEEFLKAGDFLTSKCPTWKWCTSNKKVDYLPPNKQYLMTNQVPCPRRARDYELSNKAVERELEDGWIETNVEFVKGKNTQVVDIDDKQEKKVVIDNKKNILDNYADIEVEDDNGSVKSDGGDLIEADTDNIIKTRTYDVSVSYDYYYRVPRIWLVGYNEKGLPLVNKEINEDIMLEYIDKTVTIENHPFTDAKCVSVHPCHHSDLLKKMIRDFELGGKKLDPELSVILFLKFLNSIVPTIQYDFTMNIEF